MHLPDRLTPLSGHPMFSLVFWCHMYRWPLIPADILKGVFQVWGSGNRWTVAQVDTCYPVLSGYHSKLSHNGHWGPILGYQENDDYRPRQGKEGLGDE